MKTHRLINIRYTAEGYRFDAAVDINYCLHAYVDTDSEKMYTIPIELYNFDKPEWDIKVIYLTKEDFANQEDLVGPINELDNAICHSFICFDFILKETKKWIKENK